MQRAQAHQFGDLLASWLAKSSGPDAAKLVATEIGYNDSPFFGAEKKRIRLIGELVAINTAIAIFCVNQIFDQAVAKAVIDPFLAISNKSIFNFIESKDASFKAKYQARLTEYFDILHGDKKALGLSFSFMKNLDLDPIKDLKAQLAATGRFADSIKTTLAALDVMRRRGGT